MRDAGPSRGRGERTAVAIGGVVILGSLAACASAHEAPSEDLSILDGVRVMGAEPGDLVGPLDEVLSWTHVRGLTEQEYLERERTVQNLIATCMKEQGFDYEPKVPTLSDLRPLPESPGRGTREFVEQWGYGISSQPASGGYGDTFVVWGDFSATGQPAAEPGRSEWERALNGTVIETVELTDDDGRVVGLAENFDGSGCSSLAWNGLSRDEEALRAVVDEAEAFLSAMPTSSAFDELNREWSTCMREVGYQYASPHEAYWASLPDPSGTWLIDPEKDAHRIAPEIELATADLDCRERLDYVRRYNAIVLRQQQEYVDTHRADLDALVAVTGSSPEGDG